MASTQSHQRHELTSQQEEQAAVHVVIVPFPAQSHLNLLLQLSCLISSHELPVHYIGSATHIRQAKLRTKDLNALDMAKIHFHDLPTPTFISPPPDPNVSNKFPSHLMPSWEASMSLRQPVSEILLDISSKSRRVIVIHDHLMSVVVQDVAKITNAESYSFYSISAFALFFAIWKGIGKPFQIEAEPKGLPSNKECHTDEFLNFIASQNKCSGIRTGDIYNTCRAIEGTYIDLLAREEISGYKKQWAICPVLPEKLSSIQSSGSQHPCMRWLDTKAPKSVILVSFGTTISLSDEQINELARGLEKSKQKFIWVLRDADRGDVFPGDDRNAALPEGFEDRMEGIGMVARDWAPQLEILAHPSTGGFLNHCGWNSCIESITMGVPIAAWPMHTDQPGNSVLITEVLKVGLPVRDWSQNHELVSSSIIENSVRRLMASEEGREIRKRAEELGIAVRQSAEAGLRRKELDSFIAHITR